MTAAGRLASGGTGDSDTATAPAASGGHALDALDLERARLFALLGRLLAAAPDEGLLAGLAGLSGEPGTDLGAAYDALAAAARATDPVAALHEFEDLFLGVGRGEVLPYGSYYLTGFLNDRPLARLRGDLAGIGVARAEGASEPEDHLGFVCETYAGLIAGAFPDAPGDAAARFFGTHLAPWAVRCFTDIERAGSARFYRAVAALGRAAVETERAAMELPA